MNLNTGPSLELTVLGGDDAYVGRDSVRVGGGDLSIGRAEQCDWVLQARGISRQHAQVRYLNGLYFLEDRSTNGMLLNGVPMRSGEPATLRDGDRLRIDTLDIAVAIHAVEERTAPPVTTPVARPADDATDHPGRPDAVVSFEALRDVGPITPGSMPADVGHADSLDPLAWLQAPDGLLADGVARTDAPSPSWNHASPMDERVVLPSVDVNAAPAVAVLPENWDRTRSLFAMPPAPEPDAAPVPEPAPPPEPVPAPVPPPVAVPAAPTRPVDEAPVHAAAPTAPVPEGSAAALEPLFLTMLDGVIDVLRARAELKNGFRMPATLIRRTENNPLKFAPNAREAMSHLLSRQGGAFLSGEAAIADAMDDIRLHQVALLAGVRAAFDDLVAQFDPARFEDAGNRRSRFAFGGGKGAWERYRAHFDGLAADPDDRFRRLFGDEFARAYEDQLASHKRGGKPTDTGR